MLLVRTHKTEANAICPQPASKRIHIYANEIQKKTRKSLDALEYQYMWKLHSWNSSVHEIFPFDRARRCSIEGAYFGLGTHGSAARWPMRLSQFFFASLLSLSQCSAVGAKAQHQQGRGRSHRKSGDYVVRILCNCTDCKTWHSSGVQMALFWAIRRWMAAVHCTRNRYINKKFTFSHFIKHQTMCLGQQQRMHTDISY